MSQLHVIRTFPSLVILGILSVSTTAILESCTEPDREYENRLAIVGAVSLPDTVQVGESFVVSIQTGVPNNAWRQGHDEVQAIDGGYRIAPYDQAYIGPNLWAPVMCVFTHEVELSLHASGTAEILISHRLWSSSGADSTGTIVRQVIVLPSG